MPRIVLDTRDKNRVRRVRRLVRRWFGPDAQMVFGEATDNVLHHTDHKCAEITLHASGFRLSSDGHTVDRAGLSKFITNEHRESGYGLLIIAALGGDLTLNDNASWIDWRRETALSSVD